MRTKESRKSTAKYTRKVRIKIFTLNHTPMNLRQDLETR